MPSGSFDTPRKTNERKLNVLKPAISLAWRGERIAFTVSRAGIVTGKGAQFWCGLSLSEKFNSLPRHQGGTLGRVQLFVAHRRSEQSPIVRHLED
jgi:hypothetical protein